MPLYYKSFFSKMQAVSLCLFCAMAVASPAKSQGTDINYQLLFNPENVTYQVVLSQMQNLYKNNNWYWDQDMQKWVTYPAIGVAEIDLNGDQFPEIIAYPTEDIEEYGMYCPEPGNCPHYIMEVRGNDVTNLGVITGYTIAPGQDFENGYKILRVYTKNPETNPYYFESYIYSPEKDQYVPAPQ